MLCWFHVFTCTSELKVCHFIVAHLFQYLYKLWLLPYFHTWPCVVLAMPFLYLVFCPTSLSWSLHPIQATGLPLAIRFPSWLNFETFLIFTGWLLLIRYCFSTLRLSFRCFSDLFLCIRYCNGLFLSWLTSVFNKHVNLRESPLEGWGSNNQAFFPGFSLTVRLQLTGPWYPGSTKFWTRTGCWMIVRQLGKNSGCVGCIGLR